MPDSLLMTAIYLLDAKENTDAYSVPKYTTYTYFSGMARFTTT